MIEILLLIMLAPVALLAGMFCLGLIANIILELKDIFK